MKQANRKKKQKSIGNKEKRVNRKKVNTIKRKEKLKIELNKKEIVLIIQKLLFKRKRIVIIIKITFANCNDVYI